MTITARFSSVCPACSGRIRAGEQINWRKGTKATHLDCGTGPAALGAASSGRHCPDCSGPISAWELRKGYHCQNCTRAEEGPGYTGEFGYGYSG
jgi:hypothetical protein